MINIEPLIKMDMRELNGTLDMRKSSNIKYYIENIEFEK
jgi:hypothetical protein